MAKLGSPAAQHHPTSTKKLSDFSRAVHHSKWADFSAYTDYKRAINKTPQKSPNLI
jgi:hypothetical protein